ncbi:DinB family protein [Skermanella rosea]|uniref:DinB family protein n=1 Tax=Skermanella rosea TaxID=1817965 RepID=UPI0019331EFE|nr:DinB family protein [Skermanella rosea]UEM03509.1 DinB family protein [Skermanella rosea]
MTPEYFRTLARYNAWANRHLYDACAALPDAEFRKPRQVFFGSILGTLNHVLVADRAWLGRLEGVPSGIAALDQILYEDLADLTAARTTEDTRITALVDGYGAGEFGRDLVYRTMVGTEHRTPVAWVLSHLFNHQTHHRGQAHGLLSQTAVPPPALDLIYFLREREADVTAGRA